MKIQATFETLPTMAGRISMPSTRCPNGKDIMVGSSMCMLCSCFASYDADSKVVDCNKGQ